MAILSFFWLRGGVRRPRPGATFSAVAFVGLLGAQVGGLLADRTDPPRVAAAAAFLCAAAFVAALWAPTTPVLIGCLMPVPLPAAPNTIPLLLNDIAFKFTPACFICG